MADRRGRNIFNTATARFEHWVIVVGSHLTDDQEHAELQMRQGFQCASCTEHPKEENGRPYVPSATRPRTKYSVAEQGAEARKSGKYGDNEEWKLFLAKNNPQAKPLTGDELDANTGLPQIMSRARWGHCSRIIGYEPYPNPLLECRGTYDPFGAGPCLLHQKDLGMLAHNIAGTVLWLRVYMGVHTGGRVIVAVNDENDKDGCDEPDGIGEEGDGDELDGIGEEGDGDRGSAHQQDPVQEAPPVTAEAVHAATLVWEELVRRLRELGVGRFIRERLRSVLVHGKNEQCAIKLSLTGVETEMLHGLLVVALPGLLPNVCPSSPPRTDPTPEILRALVLTIKWYELATLPYIKVGDMPALHEDAKVLMKTLMKVFNPVKNMAVPKLHMLLHITGHIAMAGNLKNLSAEGVELLHPYVRTFAQRTNRHIGWQGRCVDMMGMKQRFYLACEQLNVTPQDKLPFDIEDVGKGATNGSESDEAPSETETKPFSDRFSEKNELDFLDRFAADLAKRVRRKRNFPSWQAALAQKDTQKALTVEANFHRKKMYIKMAKIDTSGNIRCEWGQKHMVGLEGLRSALARFLTLFPGAGSDTLEQNHDHVSLLSKLYSGMTPTRVSQILTHRIDLCSYTRVVIKRDLPVLVMCGMTFRNENLTGQKWMWGGVKTPGTRHTTRLLPNGLMLA